MRKFFPILLVLFSLLYINCQGYYTNEQLKKSTNLIGKTFTDNNHSELEEFKNFKKITDTNFVKSGSYKEYGIKHLKNENNHILLLLDRLEDDFGVKTGKSEILDLQIITTKDNEGMAIGYCGEDSRWDTDRIYTVTFDINKAKNTKSIIPTIASIWKIDEKNGFQQIQLTDQFQCLEDPNYFIELAKL